MRLRFELDPPVDLVVQAIEVGSPIRLMLDGEWYEFTACPSEEEVLKKEGGKIIAAARVWFEPFKQFELIDLVIAALTGLDEEDEELEEDAYDLLQTKVQELELRYNVEDDLDKPTAVLLMEVKLPDTDQQLLAKLSLNQ